MLTFFIISTIVFFLLSVVLSFFLYKFAKIIMVFEDDLAEAIQSMNEVEDTVNTVLEMQMFFDSPEVKKSVQDILEQVKLCRITIQKVIARFTQRSKRQYVTIWDSEEEEEEIGNEMNQYDNSFRLPGQPPGTPNPMDMIRREGLVLDVGRSKRK